MALDERVAHTISSRSKLVGDGRIDIFIVRRRIARGLRSQAVLVHREPAKNKRQEFVVGDVLDESDDYAPRFLVEQLVVPLRIDGGQ